MVDTFIWIKILHLLCLDYIHIWILEKGKSCKWNEWIQIGKGLILIVLNGHREITNFCAACSRFCFFQHWKDWTFSLNKGDLNLGNIAGRSRDTAFGCELTWTGTFNWSQSEYLLTTAAALGCYFTNLKPYALMEHYTWFNEDTVVLLWLHWWVAL